MFSVSKNLIKRIKFCETMLDEQMNGDQNVEIENVESEKKIQKRPSKPPLPPSSSIKVIQENIRETETETVGTKLNKVQVEYAQFPEFYNTLCQRSTIQQYFFGTLDFSKYEEFTVLSDKANEIILAIDRNSSQRKVIILAIQSKLEEVEFFLAEVAGFLFLNDTCSEIRVSLLHVPSANSTISVNSDVEKRLKGMGFRWVCVSNNEDIRTTVYALKRPLNTKPNIAGQAYPIMI